jgi:hypothetical protein
MQLFRPSALVDGLFYYFGKVAMSNSNEDHENEKPAPNSESVTWGELERLEEAAEAGDLEAQKRLIEMEGLEDYEEYKRLDQQIIVDVPRDTDPTSASILRAIVGENTLKDIANMAQTFGDLSVLSPDDARRLAELFANNDELGKFTEVANQPWMQELKTVLNPENDRISKMILDGSQPGMDVLKEGGFQSEASMVPYWYPPEDRVADEMAENNRITREILNELRRQNEGITPVTEIIIPPKNLFIPNRPSDLKRWKVIWKNIKLQWDKGGNLNSIKNWLDKMHPGLACSIETLRKITKAGEKGLLT